MRSFFHLARNTFRECLREPVFLLLLLTALFLTGMFPGVALFVFREQTKLVTDSAMATTLVFALLAAVLCSAHAITREIRNGTALLLLAKPVPRWSFIQAKLAGLCAALAVFVVCCTAATLVSLRVAKDQFELDYLVFYAYYLTLGLAAMGGGIRNYFARKSFAETTILLLLLLLPLLVALVTLRPTDEDLPRFPAAVLPAMLLVLFATWVMAGITVVLSTRLDLTSNLVCTTTIFVLGLIADYLHGRLSGQAVAAWRWGGGLLYAALPNWQFFWMADALAAQQPIPWRYIGWAALYLALYLTGCSLAAAMLFSGREVGDEPLV